MSSPIHFAVLLACVGVLLSAIPASADDSADQLCAQQSPCKCVNRLGMGIDLSALTAAKYLMTPGPVNQLTYYFHPCADIDLTVTDDSGNGTTTSLQSTLFAYNHTDRQLIGLGKASSTEFVQDTPNDEHYLAITHKSLGSGTDSNNTLITLACTTSAQDHLFVLSQWKLILYSSHACVKQLDKHDEHSTGTTLLIVFVSLVSAYLFLGMVANYYLVGARGIEMLPNLAFWRDLPQLVRDGVEFLQNGCRPSARDDILSSNSHHPNQDSYVSI